MTINTNEVEIREFDGKDKTVFPLAVAYMKSYNELSKQYKSREEMALYTYETFFKKLGKTHGDKKSSMFVLYIENEPKGFVRYSPIPDYYKNPENNIAKDREIGEMDGYSFAWERKVRFSSDEVKLDDNTLCVNQIYLDPNIQGAGMGTKLLKETLPKMKDKGFDSIIIEYNSRNLRAKKFYAHVLGLKKIAETKDFDHIVLMKNRTTHCISDVEIGHSYIDNSMASIKKIEQSRYQENPVTRNMLERD